MSEEEYELFNEVYDMGIGEIASEDILKAGELQKKILTKLKSIDEAIDFIPIDELQDRINAVINDMKHFHLIYDEDGKLISSDKSIYAEIRYFIDKLEGIIPTTMTPFEHGMWERENRNNEDNN